MLLQEAEKIGQLLNSMEPESIDPVLNIGSSTLEFREKVQPWINQYIFDVLLNKNISVLHADIKDGDGIDLVGDLSSKIYQEELKKHQFNLVICANLLEHINNKEEICALLESIVKKDGYLLLTVPRSYHYHPDPIDTMYRPSPDDLFSLFSKMDKEVSEVIECGNYYDVLKNNPKKALKTVVRILMPFYKPKNWWVQMGMLAWLFKNYKVTLLVLKKTKD